MAKKTEVTQSTESNGTEKSEGFTLKNPDGPVSPGQGKWLRIHLDVDTRPMDPDMNAQEASDILSMCFELSRAKKAGDTVQFQNEDGEIENVRVTKTFAAKIIDDLRAPLLERGAEDKRTEKKAKSTVQVKAPVFGRPILEAS